MTDQITCVCGTEFTGNAAKLVRIRLEQLMSKLSATLLALLLAGCGGGGGATTPVPTPPPPAAQTVPAVTGTVVFMGDSITAHWNEPTWQIVDDPVATTDSDVLLSNLVPNVVDAGIPGQTSQQMLARFQTDVLALNPTTVVIEAGTNDLFQESCPDIQAVSEMAEEAAAAGITVVIALIPPTNNWGAMHFSGETGNDAVIAWNMALQQMANAYGYKVADYYSAMVLPDGSENITMFYVDGIHPISPGYAAMWSVLKGVL
jgi:lysophospholipase L1-like esterase